MGSARDVSWDDLKLLLAVHRGGSFLAAGRGLKLSTSTTARRVAALEAAVGRRLVVKTTAGTRLESGAMGLVELAESVEVGLRESQRQAEALAGTVRVSTGEGFAGPLVPAFAALRRRSPELCIELITETRLVDLTRQEAELGVRTGRSKSAVLIERPLGRVRFALYGAKDFVERRARGTALNRAMLERLDFVGTPGRPDATPQSRWLHALGAKRFGFRANTDAVLLEAIREGAGLGVLPRLIGDAEPGLQRIEVEPPAPELGVWLAYRRELRAVPRVRAVAEVIEATFKERLG